MINLSALGAQPTGMGVYARNCAMGLSQFFDVDMIANHDFGMRPHHLLESPASIGLGADRWAALRRQVWLRQIRIPSGQLVYSPTHHGIPGHPHQILTVHDLIALRYPLQHKSQYLYFRHALPRILRRVRAVFTVSQTTKEDLMDRFRIRADDIFIVPNSAPLLEQQTKDTTDRRSEQGMLLAVGARYPHKNIDEIIRFSFLWSGKYKLVVTSCDGAYKKQLTQACRAAGIADRVQLLGYVSHDHLEHLYHQCTALVYPSKWEGFGIPALEAMARGKPVIASDIPAHREVLGDAAWLVRLNDQSSWEQCIAALDDANLVAQKAKLAKGVLERFSLKNATAALIQSVSVIEADLAKRAVEQYVD